MVRPIKKNTPRLAVAFTICGAILLIIMLIRLTLRCQAVERELDRMLVESLMVHTMENAAGAKRLISDTQEVLKDAAQIMENDIRELEEDWVAPFLRTMNLGGRQFELSFLDVEELSSLEHDSETQRVFQQLLARNGAVSDIITTPNHTECYFLVAWPVIRNGEVAGAVQAKLASELLVQQGQQSSFFQTVHSVVTDSGGKVVYGSLPEMEGSLLVELGQVDGLTESETEQFLNIYTQYDTHSFFYDPAGGRHYTAWAPVDFNGWRVVQFSQSPNVQISRSSMVQTAVMMVSLALCVILAALAWRQKSRLAAEKLRYDTLAQFKDTLLFEYDCSTDSLEFTSNALNTLELDQVRLDGISNRENDFPIFHPDDLENVREILSRAGNMAPDQIEHDRTRMKKREGGYSWYRCQYKTLFSSDGRATRVIGTLTDISMQIDREQELRKQAQQDPLTGLYNRACVKLINARLEQVSRGVLFMLDLDDFKSVNDTYGHAVGDQLLVAIAHILTETFRSDDIVARVGGDEFMAFMSGADSRAAAEQKGQEILARVRDLKVGEIDMPISVSVGAAVAPNFGRTYEALSIAADEALYHVKNHGKSGFVLR